MAFASFRFLLVFLPVVVVVAYYLRRHAPTRWIQWWLLGSSLAFYAVGARRAFPVLLVSILANWVVARAIEARPAGSPGRTRMLQTGLAFNLLLLGAFKYIGFVSGTINTILPLHLPVMQPSFPLGISFFTLMQIMYLVDCYEGLAPSSTLFDHATFASFFPHITAGPLTRSREFLAQLPLLKDEQRRSDLFARGLLLFVMGLGKKVLIADPFARVADAAWAHVPLLSSVEAWSGSAAFTLQIYFDFSGYSDMALGAAMMLGIVIPRNFDSPYRATSIADFWQRWHMSLTSFITTYLYTPIIRSRGRPTLALSAVATLIAMTIAGLWHGPAWHYVVWGAMHGAALAGYQYWKKRKHPLPDWLGWACTLLFVHITMIVFRAPDLRAASVFLRHLVPAGLAHGLDAPGIGISSVAAWPALLMLCGVILAFIPRDSIDVMQRFRPTFPRAVLVGALALTSLLYLNSVSVKAFVYRAF